MSREDALKVLADIAAADGLSYWIVGALTLIVFAVMRAMLPVKGLSVVFAPAVFWGGLTGIYAAGIWGVSVSADKAANLVATAGLGMIAALIVMVLLTRLFDAITRIRNPLADTGAGAERRTS